MTVRILLVSMLLAAASLVGVTSVALAQTARGASPRDLYHQGAKLFVDGDNAGALAAVESGLAVAPDDARLQALRDLIQQKQDENDQQDQSQDPQDGDGEPDPQEQDSQDGEQDQGGPSQDGEQDDRSPEAEQDGTAQQPPPPSGQGQAQPRSGEPAEMTQAQADRLLDAVGGEERLLLREMRRAPTQRRRGDKDW